MHYKNFECIIVRCMMIVVRHYIMYLQYNAFKQPILDVNNNLFIMHYNVHCEYLYNALHYTQRLQAESVSARP